MKLWTAGETMAQVTLQPVESKLHDVEYEVTRKSDGKVLGTVYRRIYRPNVNYPGTRIRKTFKGSPKWFARLPFAQQTAGPRHHRLPRDTRWQAVSLLLDFWDRQ